MRGPYELRAIAPGSFDTHGEDWFGAGSEGNDLSGAGNHRLKLLDCDVSTCFRDDGDAMCVGVGVNSAGDFRLFVCDDQTNLTFHCVRWNTKGTPAGWAHKTAIAASRTGSPEMSERVLSGYLEDLEWFRGVRADPFGGGESVC